MKQNSRSSSRASWGRTGAAVCAGAIAASAFGAAKPAEGGHHGGGLPQGGVPAALQRLVDEAEIEKLTYCYAEATDTIGRGDLEGGRSRYQQCFTSNAIVAAYYPGDDPNGPPSLISGPSAWADVAKNEFDTAGYVSTQHLNGNVVINVQGNTGTMKTYLQATHVLEANSSVEVAHGWYDDIVVRTPQGWRIAKRTLHLQTFLRIESP
ncbi:nuclear transport factor 2 family protein [Polyangium mundeleinium]|uniref:Nuclear transport factor 2 family protein n=1 Tax=Polyangium mundeleinium TaxID=2995306 RepID=A0ABT5ET01_9BACT|nr:nuclear transport factor 2 family protein [Polyangium mundeleinium]MDC0744891.1 nuclear transport factor 2 family protein [Polyangium mundeleinium]